MDKNDNVKGGAEYSPRSHPAKPSQKCLIVEALAVLFYLSVFLFVGPLSLVLLLYVPFATDHWLPRLFTTVYVIYWLWDLTASRRGGRNKAYTKWMRGWRVWQHFVKYFPIRLVKTCPIPPNKNYIFCSHPHGVLCFGVWGAMATEGADFSVMFPGISPHLLTLEGQFLLPGFRELLLGSGSCASSKKSMQYLLSHGQGTALVLVVGGLPEMANFHPDKIVLVIKKRKGFIKLALQHGADLVPVFTFGETELFHQSSTVNSYLEVIAKYMGFAPIFFVGRGILQKSFGILPERVPLNVVVGEPIRVDKVTEPSVWEISELQAKYIAAVEKLFQEHRKEFGETKQLVIV